MIFFSQEVALGYTDEVLDMVIRVAMPESTMLTGVQSRDETTRADIASSSCGAGPGGEAIVKARESLAHCWCMEDKTIAHSPRNWRKTLSIGVSKENITK